MNVPESLDSHGPREIQGCCAEAARAYPTVLPPPGADLVAFSLSKLRLALLAGERGGLTEQRT